jgi:hypothetical protein
VKKKWKRMTVEEGMAELNADPEWVAALAREDAERAKRGAEYARAEAPLVAELRAAGVPVDSVWDLRSASGPYPEAVPILLAHLPKPYPTEVRDGIARALGVPDASYAWSTLKRLYRDEQDERVKDGLAVALVGAANHARLGDVVALVRDPRQGPSRILLLGALENSSDPRARAALMDLGTDPDLTLEIQDIFKREKAKQARRAKRALERQARTAARGNAPAKPAKPTAKPTKPTKPTKR